jgi:hypothetical protein
VADDWACVEWAEHSGSRVEKVRLLDMGGGGARIAAVRPPPSNRQACARLERPSLTDWASASVVWVGKDREAGLQFSSYCPGAFSVGDDGSRLS